MHLETEGLDRHRDEIDPMDPDPAGQRPDMTPLGVREPLLQTQIAADRSHLDDRPLASGPNDEVDLALANLHIPVDDHHASTDKHQCGDLLAQLSECDAMVHGERSTNRW